MIAPTLCVGVTYVTFCATGSRSVLPCIPTRSEGTINADVRTIKALKPRPRRFETPLS